MSDEKLLIDRARTGDAAAFHTREVDASVVADAMNGGDAEMSFHNFNGNIYIRKGK